MSPSDVTTGFGSHRTWSFTAPPLLRPAPSFLASVIRLLWFLFIIANRRNAQTWFRFNKGRGGKCVTIASPRPGKKIWRGLVSEELLSKKVVLFIATSKNMILKFLVNNENITQKITQNTRRRNWEKERQWGEDWRYLIHYRTEKKLTNKN